MIAQKKEMLHENVAGLLRANGRSLSKTAIAKSLGRSVSTIARECTRNGDTMW